MPVEEKILQRKFEIKKENTKEKVIQRREIKFKV
jgi:hypothetical protein